MAKITNTPVITLTHEETRDALVEGLRKKFGKKVFPADLKAETVEVAFEERQEADGNTEGHLARCVVTLPEIESTVAAPEAPAEPQA